MSIITCLQDTIIGSEADFPIAQQHKSDEDRFSSLHRIVLIKRDTRSIVQYSSAHGSSMVVQKIRAVVRSIDLARA